MIKAIIFDCFGVLTTEGWQEFKATHFVGKEKELSEAINLNRLADEGKMNHEQLMPLLAEQADLTVAQVREEIDDYRVNKKLIVYIKNTLIGKYKIGMLSNVSDNWLLEMFESEQLEMFDCIALSYKIGYSKPHPKAYEYITDNLELQPEECLFIDDLDHNVQAAMDIGMKSIQYKDFGQMKNEIEKILEMADTDK